jgi:hypothetical protein
MLHRQGPRAYIGTAVTRGASALGPPRWATHSTHGHCCFFLFLFLVHLLLRFFFNLLGLLGWHLVRRGKTLRVQGSWAYLGTVITRTAASECAPCAGRPAPLTHCCFFFFFFLIHLLLRFFDLLRLLRWHLVRRRSGLHRPMGISWHLVAAHVSECTGTGSTPLTAGFFSFFFWSTCC